MAEHDVRITRTIHADADRVWATLTDPAAVKQWMMGATVTSTWKAGASIEWRGEYEGTPFTDTGEVEEVEVGKRLVHTHVSGSAPDAAPHTLTWTLDDAHDGATKLTLVQTGSASEQEAEQSKQNWAAMLDGLRDTAEQT